MAGLAVCAALLIIFHRPILLAIGRQVALRYAAGEHLKADFRLEGNPFSNLTVRNLRAFAVGPSGIESIDIEYLYIDYSLFGLARHGLSHFLDNVESRSARIVLNPAKAPLRLHPPKAKIELPSLFPERIRLTDATLVIRNQPHDFVTEHVDLDLNPRTPSNLRIEKLQLPAGESWSKVSGQTSYANKNLIIRDLVLSDQEKIHLLSVDASHVDAKTLAINLDCAVGGGQLSGWITLGETKSSLDTKMHLAAENVAVESLNKFLILPEGYLSAQIERLNLEGTGAIDSPRTWNGTLSLRMSKAHWPEISFDTGVVEVSANQGKATLRSADLVQGQNEFHLRGTTEMPADFKDFGRNPASLEIAGTVLDLQGLTAGMPQPLSGTAQLNGKIDIVNAKIEANLNITADSVNFANGTIEKLSATARASKIAGQIRWKQQVANGQLSISGSNLKMRDLVFKQLSSQCSISNNVIYLNDLTASLNVHDFVGGHGSLNLHAPYHYSGRASTSVSNLSTLQPMLRAFGNQNDLAGSLSFDWERSGDAQTFKNSGKLKLTLEKGRYGGLQSLRANIDATYSPDGLDVPIVFFASNKMDFQAIAQAKGETLEISKIQLDQGSAKFAAGYASIPFVWRNLGTSASVCPS